MSTWISFCVNTADKTALLKGLGQLSGANEVRKGVPSSSIDDVYPTNSGPTVFLLGATQPDWITVFHNSIDKLEKLAGALSGDLDTLVIVTMAQSVSGYYYFALYDRGRKLREIEECHSDDSEPLNYGAPFDFEGPEPGNKVSYDGTESYLFDFESLEDYSRHFGLVFAPDLNAVSWTLLQRATGTLGSEQKAAGKPWWKFW